MAALCAPAAWSCSSSSASGGGADASVADGRATDAATPALDGGALEAAAGDASLGADGPTVDADASSDGAPQGCPATPPTGGSACVPPQACEYGGDPHGQCTTVARCEGQWVVSGPDAGCGVNPGSCPGAFTGNEGHACPKYGTECQYPQGLCQCDACQDDAGVIGRFWHCLTWNQGPPGCPSPRPLLGSPCTTQGKQCLYDNCCEGPALGPAMRCSQGAWQSTRDTGCSCKMPKCP